MINDFPKAVNFNRFIYNNQFSPFIDHKAHIDDIGY